MSFSVFSQKENRNMANTQAQNTSQTFCGTANVSNLQSNGVVSWFSSSSGGTALSNSAALKTGTYYLEETIPLSTTNLGSGFNNPFGIAIQSDGKIIIADTGNNVIRRMNADGTGIVNLNYTFTNPTGVAVQSDGKILIADFGNNAIKRMNADGSGLVTVKSGINQPRGVAVLADGRILYAETGSSRVMRMNSNGSGATQLGGSNFSSPFSVTVQADGKILVVDTGNNAIKLMNANGSGVTTLVSGLNQPRSIAVQSDGKILFSDTNNNLIKRMNADGSNVINIGNSIQSPTGIAIQTDGKIIVANFSSNKIVRITESYKLVRIAVNVTIANLAPSISIAPVLSAVCTNEVVALTASLNPAFVTILEENFNSSSNNWTTINNSEGLYPEFANWTLRQSPFVTSGYSVNSNDNSQMFVTKARSNGSITNTSLISPTFSTLGMSSASLSFWHSNKHPYNNQRSVLYSIDGGLSWNNIVSYNTLEFYTYDITLEKITINLPEGAVNKPNVRIKFQYECLDYGLFWAIDTIKITGIARVTWSPVTNLFTDAAATIPYTAGLSTPVVYAKPTTSGTKTYTAMASTNPICTSNTAAVTITVKMTPNAPTASSQTFCGNTTVANLTASGTGLKWYASVTGGTSLNGGFVLNTKTYYVSQTINGCESNRTAVNVIVNVTPPTLSLSPTSSTVCINEVLPLTISANPTAITILQNDFNDSTNNWTIVNNYSGDSKWHLRQSPHTIVSNKIISSNDNSQMYVVNNPSEGGSTNTTLISPTFSTLGLSSASLSFWHFYIYFPDNQAKVYYSIDGGVNWTILVNFTSDFNSFTNVNYNLPNLALNKTNVKIKFEYNSLGYNYWAIDNLKITGIATITWSPITNLFTDIDATVAYSSGTSASIVYVKSATAGTITYTAKATTAATCTTTANTTVTINPIPGIPIASNQAFCGSGTVANLQANGTALKWYLSATGGTVLTNSTALTTRSYYVSQTTNGCESPRKTVGITINTIPTTPIASNQTFCGSGTVANLQANGTSLKWYLSATGGTVLTNSTALTTRNYYVSQTTNGCESPRKTVGVTLNTIPATPNASAQSFCAGKTVADLNPAISSTVKWYNVATLGTSLVSTTALSTGTYYVSQTNTSGCESARTSVSVTINTIPISPTVTTPIIYIQGAAATPLTATVGANGTSLLWYTTASGGTGLTTLTPSTSTAGNTSYWVSSINANRCESTRIEIVVAVNVPATNISFDGLNDLVSINNSTGVTFTLEAYVKTSTPSPSGNYAYEGAAILDSYLSGSANNFSFSILNNKLSFYDGSINLNLNGSTNIVDGNWHHVAVVRTSNESIKLYVDGALDSQSLASGSMVLNQNPKIFIGASTTTGTFLNASIDEVRIWNKALSVAQILNNLNCELQSPTTQNGLIAYYKFNQGFAGANNTSATTLLDSSTSCNNGTLINFALTGTTSNWLADSPIITGGNCAILGSSNFDLATANKLYPNPTSGKVTIEVNNLTHVSVSVYDLNGRIIKTKDLSSFDNSVDISNLQSGMYLFKIKSQEGETIKKVLKN